MEVVMFLTARDCFVAYRRKCNDSWHQIADNIDVSLARAQTINNRFNQRISVLKLCKTEPDEEFWEIVGVIAERYKSGQSTILETENLEHHIRNIIRSNV
jgi:hypothetical protein